MYMLFFSVPIFRTPLAAYFFILVNKMKKRNFFRLL